MTTPAAAAAWTAAERADLRLRLRCLPLVKAADPTPDELDALVAAVEPVRLEVGAPLLAARAATVPALYLLMKGRVRLERPGAGNRPLVLLPGQTLGEDLLALGADEDGDATVPAPFSAAPLDANGVCGRLTRAALRNVLGRVALSQTLAPMTGSADGGGGSRRGKKDRTGSLTTTSSSAAWAEEERSLALEDLLNDSDTRTSADNTEGSGGSGTETAPRQPQQLSSSRLSGQSTATSTSSTATTGERQPSLTLDQVMAADSPVRTAASDRSRTVVSPSGRVRQESLTSATPRVAHYLEAAGRRSSMPSPATERLVVTTTHAESDHNVSRSRLAYLEAIAPKKASAAPSPRPSPTQGHLQDLETSRSLYLDAAARPTPRKGSGGPLALDLGVDVATAKVPYTGAGGGAAAPTPAPSGDVVRRRPKATSWITRDSSHKPAEPASAGPGQPPRRQRSQSLKIFTDGLTRLGLKGKPQASDSDSDGGSNHGSSEFMNGSSEFMDTSSEFMNDGSSRRLESEDATSRQDDTSDSSDSSTVEDEPSEALAPPSAKIPPERASSPKTSNKKESKKKGKKKKKKKDKEDKEKKKKKKKKSKKSSKKAKESSAGSDTEKPKEAQSTEGSAEPDVKNRVVALRQSFESVGSAETPSRRPPPNIFQKKLTVDQNYTAPVFEKSDKTRNKISKAMSALYAFRSLETQEKGKMIAAFEPKRFGPGTAFVKAGENDDFFYVVDDGTVAVEIEGKETREYREGDAFGESNLVHSAPTRNKSIRAKSDVSLYRVDQTTYRSIMQLEILKSNSKKHALLNDTKLFEKVSDMNKQKLVDVMQPRVFMKGETVVRPEHYGERMFLVEEGEATCELAPGKWRIIGRTDYFGETGVDKDDSKPMKVVAKTDLSVYTIERGVFETILGPTTHVIMSEVDARVVSAIPCLEFSVATRLKTDQVSDLLTKIEDQNFSSGQTILDSGVDITAALYFVRSGGAAAQKGRMESILGPGAVFGTDLFEDARERKSLVGKTSYKVIATERTTCGVLKIEDWYDVKRKYVKVHTNLQASNSKIRFDEELKRHHFELSNLVKRVLLGEGQFGQVWMVHDKTESPLRPYALKIQSKFQLIEEGQAEACIREKEALSVMFHPNIIKLYATFQDKDFVYMLLQPLQGGELFNLIHPINADISTNGIPEANARFYTFCLADAIAHIHSKKYVYRDMKPENVLIDADGYPVLIDFGFSKKMVDDKTFTLCGTPGYLPPECCLSAGHSFAADHWSLGILTYEMLCGESPFFFYGVDTSELYRSIVEDPFPPMKDASTGAMALVDGLLTKDPKFRLGSLAGGESDIISHDWFRGLDVFQMRRKELKAPWRPGIKDPFDAQFFEDWSNVPDKTTQKYLRLTEAEGAIFKDF